jgi:SAM-dependent methyltransferase
VFDTPFDTIWNELRSQWGLDIPADVRAPWDAHRVVSLVRCTGCELEYFVPLLPGDPAFWAELARQTSLYVDHRWEFDAVLQRAAGAKVLLDFGSGAGAFLRLAASTVPRVIGCDHNEGSAVGELGGATLRFQSFADVAADLRGQVDVVTSFHVLEHLATATELVKPALDALRPGGRLFLSTPDRERSVHRELEPLDFPPHHVSRWSGRQFERLATHFDLRLASIRHEPFVARHGIRRAVPRPVLDLLGAGLRRSQGYRVSVAPAPPRLRGSSILAELVRP